MERKAIDGFSNYSTDGVKVFRNSRPVRIVRGVYKLIPDGERVNTVDVSIDKALAGNIVKSSTVGAGETIKKFFSGKK